jgi:long-chain acyl-CoA synthetase
LETNNLKWENKILLPVPRTTDSMLSNLAKTCPHWTAAKDTLQAYTYTELDQITKTLAQTLLGKGVTRGSIVAIDLPVDTNLLIAFCAVTRMGAIALHLYDLLKPEEIEHILSVCNVQICVGDSFHRLNKIRQLPLSMLLRNPATTQEYVSPLEAMSAQIRLTSGTTNRPKMIKVPHSQVCRRLANPGFHYQPLKKYGCPVPHTFPTYQIFSALGAGGTIVFRHAISSHQIEDFIMTEQINCFWGIPAFYEQIAHSMTPLKNGLTSLESTISSGSTLLQTTKELVEDRWKVPLYQFYGQSELGFITETLPDTPSGSLGQSVSGVKIRIADPNGVCVKSHQTGRIQVQTDVPFQGYLSGEQSPLDKEGWFTTGDIGYLDNNNNLYLLGRENDLIHVSGFKVNPMEVTEIIRRIPGITDAYVFGVKHTIRGEQVAAAIVAEPGLRKSMIRKLCRQYLPGYKCPAKIYFLTALPRNSLGKVVKSKVIELIQPVSDPIN